MKYRIAKRGKFRTLLTPSGEPVEFSVNCVVTSPFRENDKGKTFVTVRIELEDAIAVRAVESRILEACEIRYSPLSGSELTIKVPRDVRWDSSTGEAWCPLPGARLVVCIRLGSFGEFGYCWLARRISRDT